MSIRRMTTTIAPWALAITLATAPPLPGGDGREPEEHAALGSLPLWYSPRTGPGETVNEYTSTTPVPVPDAQCPAWSSSAISVPDQLVIADVNVGIWMTHTFRGDLEIRLRAPDGTTVSLFAHSGGGADNINALFDDSAPGPPDSTGHAAPPPYYTDHPWRPAEPLAGFRGVPSAGDWTLELCDDAGGDVGTLEQWTLFVESDVVLLEPPVQFAHGCPGDQVPFELTVVNGTVTAQAFGLSYSGNAWAVVGPGATGTVPSGGEETISLTHGVPGAATAGDSDTVLVTATGSMSDSATAATEVPLVAGWGDLAPLTPAARPTRHHGAVWAAGRIYKIGGWDGAARPYLDIYDVATDSWSTGADMPSARYLIDCAAIGGKILCAGGLPSTGNTVLNIYDIAAGTWSTGAPLPAGRFAYTAAALDGRYVVVGGFTTTYVASVLAYDPVSNSWDTSLPAMSVARRDAQSGVIDGRLYAVGGRSSSSGWLGSGEVYDPVANAWSPIASMPVPSWLSAADGVVDGRYLIMAGGYLDSADTASAFAWSYDAVGDAWTLLPSMEHLLYGAAGASDGSTLYVVSGRLFEGAFRYSEYLSRAYECADRTDLAIAKDDGVTDLFRGDPVIYTITAANHGPRAVRRGRVADTFPPQLDGVTWTCVATGGGSCTASGVGDIDDLVDLGVGDAATYTAHATVAPDAVGDVENTASVGFGTVPDLTPADNRATDVDRLAVTVDASAAVDDGVTEVTQGQVIAATIVVANAGPDHLFDARVQDPVPAELTGVSWTCTPAGGAICTASGTGDVDDLVDIPAGGTVTYTLSATVSNVATGYFDHTVTVELLPGYGDQDPANNTDTDTDLVLVEADIAVTKDDGVAAAVAGEPLTYTIALVNNGPGGVSDLGAHDLFPPAFIGVAWSCAGILAGECPPSGVGDISVPVVLPAGSGVTFTASGTLDPGAAGTLVNTAGYLAPPGFTDPVPGNDTSTDVDVVTRVCDLAVAKDDGVTQVGPGSPLTYSITVTNAGASDAVGATVTDDFPDLLTGVAWTCSGIGGGACTAAGSGDIADAADLPVGGSVTYTATATVALSAPPGSLDNTATVAPPAGATDPDLSNNSSTDSDTVTAGVDLAVTVTDSTCYVLPGGSTTYAIAVANTGPGAAVGATVTDLFPVELTGVTWTCTGTGGATCTAGGDGDIDDLVDLPAGGGVVYQAAGTVSASASGHLVNTARVEVPPGVTDLDPTDNEDTDIDALELPVFCDGFESGATDAWSSVTP